jgi:hypothetical protein
MAKKKKKGPKYPGLVSGTLGRVGSISFEEGMAPFLAEREPITEALIQELTSQPEAHWTRKVMEEFRADGAEYVRSRDSFSYPLEFEGEMFDGLKEER